MQPYILQPLSYSEYEEPRTSHYVQERLAKWGPHNLYILCNNAINLHEVGKRCIVGRSAKLGEKNKDTVIVKS